MRGGQLKALILALCVAFVVPGYGGHIKDTADFIHVKTVKGINLYERWHVISTGELAREVKAVFRVNAAMGEVASLIKNESRALQWNKNTKVYDVEAVATDDWICYLEYDLPWPVSNQDCVLQYNQSYRGDELIINFQGINHPGFPLKNGIDRIPDVKGKWIIAEKERELIIEYYITTTPSKTLPRWITDPIIRNNLMETMRAFRNILEGN